MARRSWVWFVLVALACPAFAAPPAPDAEEEASLDEGVGAPPLGDPPGEAEAQARTMALANELRCPVCQGLSVGASPSEAARAMRDRIESLVRAGYTDDQVRDYFVDRYGTWVLLEPPKEGFTRMLWVAPLGLVALGGAALLLLGRRTGAPAGASPGAGAGATTSTPADPYRAAVLAELEDAPEGRGRSQG